MGMASSSGWAPSSLERAQEQFQIGPFLCMGRARGGRLLGAGFFGWPLRPRDFVLLGLHGGAIGKLRGPLEHFVPVQRAQSALRRWVQFFVFIQDVQRRAEVILRAPDELGRGAERTYGGVERVIERRVAGEAFQAEAQQPGIVDRLRVSEHPARDVALQPGAEVGAEGEFERLKFGEIPLVVIRIARLGEEPAGGDRVSHLAPRMSAPTAATFCKTVSEAVPGLPTGKTRKPVG